MAKIYSASRAGVTTNTSQGDVVFGKDGIAVISEEQLAFWETVAGVVVLPDEPEIPEVPVVDLKKMNVADLKTLAANLGVEVPEKLNKAELIELIEAAVAEAEGKPEAEADPTDDGKSGRVDFTDMTDEQLAALVIESKIEIPADSTRDQIIALLDAAINPVTVTGDGADSKA